MSSQQWDARYATAQAVGLTVWSAGANSFVVSELGGLPPGSAIDLACGEGRNAVWLAARGWRVTGVDFSAVGIDSARQAAGRDHVHVDWVVADVTLWTPPRPADLLLVAYLHLPPALWEALLSRCATMIVPGGILFVIGHDVQNLRSGAGGPQDPDVLYRAGMVVPGLRVVRDELVRRPHGEDAVALDRLLWAIKPASRVLEG